MLRTIWKGGSGGLPPPRRNFGRICAELWYCGPTWTKNSAYRTVPFLDFWVLEWYWNYNQLFWKWMKGIGCWIVGCTPSECFELTENLFKYMRWNNLSKGISHPVFYGDLVYKLRRVKDKPNIISSGSKIVKRLRRRLYDPVIIERTIGLVLGPSTALYEPFQNHCTLTNKVVRTIWRALSKPPQRRHGPDLCPLWLLVGTPSAIRPELAFSRAEHSRTFSNVAKYIFDM